MLITSNAFNFPEDISSGVNLRTGTFSKKIKIGYVCTNNLNGPNLDINISFNQLSNENQGFGQGWELNLSRYNASRQELYFSNGKRFHAVIDFTTGRVEIPDLLSKDVIIKVITANQIRIIYKDGTIEHLNSNGLLTKIENSDGRFLDFFWIQINGQHRLIKIGSSLLVNYGVSFISVISNTSSEIPTITRLFTVESSNVSYLESIRLPNDDYYQFSMENYHDNYFIINNVKNPNGLVEYIQYKELTDIPGLEIPIKVVDTLHCEPGGKAETYRKSFNYSTKHYLGKRGINQYGAPIIWQPNTDLLYTCQQEFEYSVTETLAGNSIKRHYNKFHLLILEEFWQNKNSIDTCYKTIIYQYPCELSKTINQQPTYYRLPIFITTSHINGTATYEQTQRFGYDEFNNILFETHPTYTINYDYYPAEGYHDRCPRDPHDFIRHLRSKTFISNDGKQLKAFTYEYTLLGQHLIVLSKEGCNGHDSHFNYQSSGIEDPSSNFGMLSSKIEFLNNKTIKTYLYERELINNILIKNETYIDPDGTRQTSSIREDINTGLTVAIQHNTGIEDNFEYDILGRVIQKIFAKGSPNESIETIHYSLNGRRQEITHPNSLVDYNEFDYFNRLISKTAGLTASLSTGEGSLSTTAGGSLLTIAEGSLSTTSDGSRLNYIMYEYDSHGNIIKETLQDRQNTVTIKKKFNYEYNSFGEQSKKINPDSSFEQIDHNHVEQTQTKTLFANGNQVNKTISYFNHSNQIRKVEVFDASNSLVSTKLFEYDAFNRLIMQTSPLGENVSYQYDQYDRVISEVSSVKGNKETSYAQHSIEDLPTVKKVNTEVVATNQYDGLGRISKETIGNNTKSYKYTDSVTSQQPSKITISPGLIVKRSYSSYHNQMMSEYCSNNGVLLTKSKKSYQYHSESHLLTEARNYLGENRYSYTETGLLEAITLSYDTKLTGDKSDACQITNSFTAMGMLMIRQVAMADNFYNGFYEKRTYDEIGRTSSIYFLIQETKVLVNIGYDSLSRPIRYEITEPSYNKNPAYLIKEIDYDDFSRPIHIRFITFDNHPIVSARMTYNEADQITQLSVKLENDIATHYTESYRYDAAGRLVEYTPSSRVLDQYKNHIVKETVNFDTKNNITSKEIQLLNGVNNTVYHYSHSNVLELNSITNSHSDYPSRIQFSYDQRGNIISDQDNIAYRYTYDNKMEAVINVATGKPYIKYEYDAEGHQACIAKYNDSGQLIQLSKKFYCGEQLALDYLTINKTDDVKWTGYHRIMDELLFTSQQKGGSLDLEFYLNLPSGTPIASVTFPKTALFKHQANVKTYTSTPYGYVTLGVRFPITKDSI